MVSLLVTSLFTVHPLIPCAMPLCQPTDYKRKPFRNLLLLHLPDTLQAGPKFQGLRSHGAPWASITSEFTLQTAICPYYSIPTSPSSWKSPQTFLPLSTSFRWMLASLLCVYVTSFYFNADAIFFIVLNICFFLQKWPISRQQWLFVCLFYNSYCLMQGLLYNKVQKYCWINWIWCETGE